MVTTAENRRRRYEAKIDSEVTRQRTESLKPMMVRQQAVYFPKVAEVETRVKTLVEKTATSSLEVRDYLNYARELMRLVSKFSGTTLALEAQAKTDKWATRGLSGEVLAKVANLFGLSPTYAPVTPFVCYASYRRSGHYYTGALVGGTLSAVNMTSDQLWAFPYVEGAPQTYDRLAILIYLARTNAVAHIGVYDDTGDVYPKALLVESGELNVATSGLKYTDIYITTKAGLYWLVCLGNNQPSVRAYAFTSAPTILGPDLEGTWETAGAILTQLRLSAYPYAPLPSTFPLGAIPKLSYIPLMGLRRA